MCHVPSGYRRSWPSRTSFLLWLSAVFLSVKASTVAPPYNFTSSSPFHISLAINMHRVCYIFHILFFPIICLKVWTASRIVFISLVLTNSLYIRQWNITQQFSIVWTLHMYFFLIEYDLGEWKNFVLTIRGRLDYTLYSMAYNESRCRVDMTDNLLAAKWRPILVDI